jgi:hypothetical protein
MALRSTQPLTEMSTRNLREPQRHITLWPSTAGYRDNFNRRLSGCQSWFGLCGQEKSLYPNLESNSGSAIVHPVSYSLCLDTQVHPRVEKVYY